MLIYHFRAFISYVPLESELVVPALFLHFSVKLYLNSIPSSVNNAKTWLSSHALLRYIKYFVFIACPWSGIFYRWTHLSTNRWHTYTVSGVLLYEWWQGCMCVSSKMCAGPMQRLVHAGPCCPAGTLTTRRAAVLSLSTAAAEATGITLSQRSTACLSAAASVSPADGGSLAWLPVVFISGLSLTLTFTRRLSKLSNSCQILTAAQRFLALCAPLPDVPYVSAPFLANLCFFLTVFVCVSPSDKYMCLH